MSIVHAAPVSRPVHAIFRPTTRKPFSLPKSAVWERLGEILARSRQDLDIHVHAAVLMSNHIHLLLTCGSLEAGPMLELLRDRIAFEAGSKISSKRPHFDIQVYSYEIRNAVNFARALKYIYRNPVSAGLCGQVEEYPFSTLQVLLGTSHFQFPLHETYFALAGIPRDPADLLCWLNGADTLGQSRVE